MDITCIKNLVKNKRENVKIIIRINENKYNLNNILKDYKISYNKIDSYYDIYYKYINSKDDICIIDLDLKYIDKLKEINKILKPEIIYIPRLEYTYTESIEKKIFKIIKKSLKNNTLIINDNDKYLKRIFKNRLDIYRYGNNMYDDIEYIEKNGNLIIKYEDKKYEIYNKDSSIIGYIIIGLLFGETIDNIIKNVNQS